MTRHMLRLQPNDSIGFFSPSTPITAFCPTRFQRAVSFIEEKGFRVIPGKLTGQTDSYRSGTIRQRADELNDLIRNPDVRCIISTIGGSNSNSLLPYIDYAAFQADPKIIIGHSDVTAILMAVYAQTGISTCYGPALVPSFGELEPYNELTWACFADICVDHLNLPHTFLMPDFWTDEHIDWETQDRPKTRNPNRWTTCREGSVEGRLIAGNLNTISCIWGSPYMPQVKDGDILLIEDTQKSAAMMERLFSFLKVNQVFDRISGLILGKHERFDDQGTGRQPQDILMEVLGDVRFPLLADVDCSHTHPMFTLPIGSKIRLDAAAQQIVLVDLPSWQTA